METVKSQENEMENLKARMQRVADNMNGIFKEEHGYEIWHSSFLDWDQTWEAADELGLTEESTDKEIEQAILTSEDWHGETYQEEVQAYIDEQENN